MSFEKNELRDELLDSFDPNNGYFYHEIPHGYDNFIDGMAWVGLLCGAALKVGDKELADKCIKYLRILIGVGDDARNFAPMQVKDNWILSATIPSLWYKKKPQSSAGPFGLMFAIKNGADIEISDDLKKKYKKALHLCKIGFFFGISARYIPQLRQHINTIFLAYLLAGKRPSITMKWMIKENPFFSYIYRKKCNVEYPDNAKLRNTKDRIRKKVTPLKSADPSSWIFRRDPFKEVISGDKIVSRYVRIAQLVGNYLQSTL